MSEEKKKLAQLLRSRRWPIEDVVDHQRQQEALRALELKASIEKHAASITEGLDVTTKEVVVDAVTQVRAELEAERRLAERVLTQLPQGDGSGLDADMVDGLHADEVAVKAAEIAQAGSGSMFGITDHGLLQGLADDDHTQYTPVDGVARQLADAGYPNAVLRDGSRAMTGDFDLASNSFLTTNLELNELTAACWRIVARGTTDLRDVMVRIIYPDSLQSSATILTVRPKGVTTGQVWFQTWNGSAWEALVKMIAQNGAGKAYVDIPQAGDITLLADRYLDLGNAASGLPAASATHRGKLGFVEGAGGARDRVYACMKSDADAYSWIEIANGGA